MSVLEDLEQMREQALAAIGASGSLTELDAVRVAYLGKKGTLTSVLRGLGTLSSEERPAVGKTANEVRLALEAALERRHAALSASALEERVAAEAVDVTLPGRRRELGHQHLINRITREVTEIFIGLGYQIAEGPEVELDYYNFTALNTPPDHPARSLADTFYVKDLSGDVAAVTGESDVLLRTQTSPVQVRYMECHAPPIYIIAPGKVYRRDVADPSHLPQFTQIEGLVVDEGITFGDLKGTLEAFVKALFGPERRTRLRPHFFPFTEPSAEVDVSCGICEGAGCRFCKGAGWLEILGCGMVDPNVLGFCDIDSERYTGFAFGMGVERIAALRYNIPDLRMLLEGDMRFLAQF
jgi:phenylalanyl-tRNA synthetase alpha chain